MSRAKMKHLKEMKRKQRRKQVHLRKLEIKKKEKLLESADLVLTARDAFDEMMRDISNPNEVNDWIKKYKLEPDLEIELRKIVAEEVKKDEENG